MKFNKLTILLFFLIAFSANAQTDLIFKSEFEFIPRLNDTGITWGGDYPGGNNATCTSNISAPQDCHHGRDATHNDDSDGHAGFSFTKLDANGVSLVDQSVDYETTPWACVRDNVTGLVWEVKTTTAGIHNKDNTYQWGGLTALGRDHPDRQGTYYDPSWNELVQGSNDETLCGITNWRVPTVTELSSIVNKGTFNPAIDSDFFPNTASSLFWSSSPVAGIDSYAWTVFFGNGNEYHDFRVKFFRVRLVRSGQ